MLSMQEVHYFTRLVEKEKVKNIITCPFDPTDIVITKSDEDDLPFFYCLSCKTSFKLNKDTEDIIRIIINKFLK